MLLRTPLPTRERSFQRDCVTMDTLGQVCGDHLAYFHNEGGENDLLCNFNVYKAGAVHGARTSVGSRGQADGPTQ